MEVGVVFHIRHIENKMKLLIELNFFLFFIRIFFFIYFLLLLLLYYFFFFFFVFRYVIKNVCRTLFIFQPFKFYFPKAIFPNLLTDDKKQLKNFIQFFFFRNFCEIFLFILYFPLPRLPPT